MKKLKLILLDIKNFKGIKQFTLQADGNNLEILGKNGSGKTTIFDSFTWLLFGRDSLNRTQFDIKELDEDGNVKQHGLEHSVRGVFELDGKRIELKRVFKEVWTKKKGTAKKKFTGHTTDYYIDDTPVKAKVYEDKIKEIALDDEFKLLTNPLYFNEQLDQKKRRAILMDMVEDVTDSQVATKSGNKELKQLIEKLEGKQIEDYQKSIKSKQTSINKELDKIPIRIDEIELSLPDVNGLDEKELKDKIGSIDAEIEEKKNIISNVRSGGKISEYQKQLSNIDMEITKIKNEFDSNANEEVYRLKARLQEKESNVMILKSKIDNEKEMVDYKRKQAIRWHDRIKELREEYREADKQQLEHNEECICPTCEQELPQEQVEQARATAEKQFNERKAGKLEAILSEADKIKKQIEVVKEEAEAINKKIEKYEDDVKANEKEVAILNESIEKVESQRVDITDNKDYVEKLQERERIEKEIAEVQTSAENVVASIRNEIEKLENERAEIQNDLNKFQIVKQSEERLVELEQQEKELAEKYEQLEHELFLTEEFTREKVNLLEERINSQFKLVKFKLFEEQINGGLKEICEATHKGVTFNRGLNLANRINGGLDIINTLNKRYGIQVPIFIDNKESVTDLIEVDSQVISLTVDKKAKTLEIVDSEEVAV